MLQTAQLDARFGVADVVPDLAGALERLRRLPHVDVLIVDRRLPGVPADALQQIVGASPPTAVVFHPGRPGPTPNGRAGDVLPIGTPVELMATTGEWANGFVIVVADDLGYILARPDDPDDPGARTPPIPSLRVRAAPAQTGRPAPLIAGVPPSDLEGAGAGTSTEEYPWSVDSEPRSTVLRSRPGRPPCAPCHLSNHR